MPLTTTLGRFIFAVVIFAAVALVHGNSKVVVSSDSHWSIPTAKSILVEGNINLDEYPEAVSIIPNYALSKHNGHIYNYFPLGPSLLALPFVWIYDNVPGLAKWILPGTARGLARSKSPDSVKQHKRLERAIASLVIAATTAFLFLTLMNFAHPLIAFFTALFFAFGTSSWSVASRGLWQHGPSLLMLSIALYLLVRAERKSSLSQYAAIPLALSYIMRPTNSISIAVLALYVLINHKEYAFHFFAWGALVIAPFLIGNFFVFDSVLPPYYHPRRLDFSATFLEALGANLISPGRGLFLFSPILVFAVIGAASSVKNYTFNSLPIFLVAIIIAHLCVISLFPRWWGGHSYGPRLFSDMLVYLSVLTVLGLEMFWREKQGQSASATTVILILAVISVFIHYQGANTWAAHKWNMTPTDIDRDQSRIWDWNDPAFLRSFKK